MSEQFPNYYPVSVADNRIVYETIACNFSAYLKARGHSDSTQHAYQSALRHFVCWLPEESLQEGMLDSSSVGTFLYEHLPVCNCPPPVFKGLKTVRAALNQLLLLLGHERLLPGASKGSVAIATAIDVINTLAADLAAGQLKRGLKRYLKPELLILDECQPVTEKRNFSLFQPPKREYGLVRQSHGTLLMYPTNQPGLNPYGTVSFSSSGI